MDTITALGSEVYCLDVYFQDLFYISYLDKLKILCMFVSYTLALMDCLISAYTQLKRRRKVKFSYVSHHAIHPFAYIALSTPCIVRFTE